MEVVKSVTDAAVENKSLGAERSSKCLNGEILLDASCGPRMKSKVSKGIKFKAHNKESLPNF
jgi:hypothetical protein